MRVFSDYIPLIIAAFALGAMAVSVLHHHARHAHPKVFIDEGGRHCRGCYDISRCSGNSFQDHCTGCVLDDDLCASLVPRAASRRVQ
jgi:hypothetical protein